MIKNIFYENYSDFKEKSLKKKLIKHNDILPLILDLKNYDNFKISELGKSVEDRQIYGIRVGFGSIKILIWSQMHGNEATGTAAIFDILNFIKNSKELTSEKDSILKNCTLYFISMLNPDGAEKNKRRNSADVDINRDARNLQTPEGQILMNYIDEIKPNFAFNLHDQEKYYSAGNNPKTATISFLAPAFNPEKEIDESRKKSMQLIVSMNSVLQGYIPQKIAKYFDTFMPNAFGDLVQKKGVSTILIESGWFAGDAEKQFVRKLNFTAIISAIKVISDNSFQKEKVSDYEKIPFNIKNKFFDIIIRNCRISKNNKSFTADVGIRDNDFEGDAKFVISDIGDLSDFYGFKEIDFHGKQIEQEIFLGQSFSEVKKFYGHIEV